MRIGYCRVSSAEQNTARQEVLMERLGVDKIFIDKFQQLSVVFISQKESLDTSTDTGRFMLTIFGAVSELERSYILSRQREGIELAKAKGVYKGRKPIDCPDFDKVYEQVQSGVITATRGWDLLGLSKSSWYRRVREKQQSQPNSQH